MSLIFTVVVNESETVASPVKNELEKKIELRPTSLLGPLALKPGDGEWDF